MIDRQNFSLGAYEADVQKRLDQMAKEDFGERLWRKDASCTKISPRSCRTCTLTLNRRWQWTNHDPQ
jgi:hypothetical protein